MGQGLNKTETCLIFKQLEEMDWRKSTQTRHEHLGNINRQKHKNLLHKAYFTFGFSEPNSIKIIDATTWIINLMGVEGCER